jgi:hypothetical protein
MSDLLSQASLPIYTVPLIAENMIFSSKQDIAELLNTASKLYNGFVEGIYLRIENEEFVEKRCKLVRPDFVQNIEEHWQKHKMVKNLIDPLFY